MFEELSAHMDRNISPVGWYIGTYLSRFIEIGDSSNSDPEAKFASWENTVLVKASDLSEAYDKVEKIGMEHAEPYKGGREAIDVQWEYMGVVNLLPIYEEIEDGAEVMWGSNNPRKLKNLVSWVKAKSEFYE